MTYRTMRNSTDIPPPPCHLSYLCLSPKNWTGPLPRLTPSSPPRSKLNNRPHSFDLTETSPIHPPPPNSTHQSHNTHNSRTYLHINWRLRRTKPNPITKNPCLLLHRPPRLNNFSPTTSPFPHPTDAPNIPYYNPLNIPYL